MPLSKRPISAAQDARRHSNSMAGYVKLLVYCDEDEIVEENSDEPVSQVFSLRLCRAGKLPSALRYHNSRTSPHRDTGMHVKHALLHTVSTIFGRTYV